LLLLRRQGGQDHVPAREHARRSLADHQAERPAEHGQRQDAHVEGVGWSDDDSAAARNAATRGERRRAAARDRERQRGRVRGDARAEPHERDAFWLDAALARLSERERTVVELAYYDDLSESAIAKRLRVPVGSVKSWKRRGLNRLAVLLGEESP